MASTVKCSSCEWSWNKSDSSKKDMYVCHQCGKDNSMKHGGWLDAYDDVPQAQNGIEGTMGGLTDQGFNYNGAWGGTMQMGGNIDSVLNANKNLDWVQRLYEENTPSIKIPKQKGRSTHFMESGDGRVYPTVVRMPNGKLKYLGDKAYDYADSTKTYIQFPSDEEALQFSKDYKKGTNVLKNFQMGGNLPGAVGFTYARTKGIPSEGKYAKKTLPSAEEGIEILPDPEDPDRKYKLSAVVQSAKEILNPILRSKNPAVYDKWEADRVAALRKNAVKDYDKANPLSIYLSPEEVKTELSKQRKGYYEDYIGALKGISEYDLGKESYVGQKESNQPIEGLNYGSRFATTPVNLGRDQKGVESFRYSYIPKTEEYRKENFQNGGKMMSFYQHGLDFTPRNISRNGGEVPQAQIGTMVTPLDFSKPLGTLQGASDVMSAPARTATYLLTGKYQDPSQALGINNPIGAFAADMILDPVNLMGVGLASKIAKGEKAVSSVAKKIKPNFKSEIDLGNLNKEIPKNTQQIKEYNTVDYKKNPLSDKEKEMYKWLDEQMRFDKLPQTTNKQSIEVLDNFKQRIKTPEGKKRMKELGIDSDEMLQKIQIVEDPNTFGYFTGGKNKIVMNPNSPIPKKVVRHEIEHGVQSALKNSKIKNSVNASPAERLKALESTTTEIDDILSELTLRKEGTPNKVWDISKITDDLPVKIDEYKSLISNKQNATDYFLTGSEGKEKSAFLGEVQQYMMDTGKIPKNSYTEITPEMVKETMIDAMFDDKGGGKYLRLFNIIKANPKNYELISKGLNKMLTVSPFIGAGALQEKKQGGEVKKDDMGYWNPDNWGEPVEIGSNEITMDGVYEPLMGVSDEGDVQMMYPGEDYKFKGKKVTEYPVKKNGGWLDKY